jgi:hypothetical protein
MKTKITLFAMLCASLTFTACKNSGVNSPDEPQQEIKTKKFKFTLKGDFSSEWKPVYKAPAANEYLSADGKEMTDVWVFDYMGGELKQQVHQSSEDEDFGVPQMDLQYGSHHVYFVVSRGQTPTLDTDAKTIVWTKPLDTFWVDYLCDVVATSNGNRSVTLDRAVTKLKLTFTDAIPSGAATINITPHTWYYGLNYATGEPCAAATDQVFTISIPSTEIGKTGVFTNMYGFSTTTEWTTDIAANSKTSANQVLGSCTIEDAPFKANRVTEYSGPLFNAGGVMELSLNTDWDDSYNGTW